MWMSQSIFDIDLNVLFAIRHSCINNLLTEPLNLTCAQIILRSLQWTSVDKSLYQSINKDLRNQKNKIFFCSTKVTEKCLSHIFFMLLQNKLCSQKQDIYIKDQ